MEGARFDYHRFEERLQALMIHDTQLKAAVDAGLLLNDSRRRIASTQPPEVRVNIPQISERSTKEEAISSGPRRRKELLGRSVVTRGSGDRRQPDQLDDIAPDVDIRGTKASRRASKVVLSTPPASEVTETSQSKRALRMGARASRTPDPGEAMEARNPSTLHRGNRKTRARVAGSRSSRQQSLLPVDTVPSALRSTILTLLTAVGAPRSESGSNASASPGHEAHLALVPARPAPRTRRGQTAADVSGAVPQHIHFHLTISGEPLSLPRPAVQPLYQLPQTRGAIVSRLRNVKTSPSHETSMLVNSVQSDRKANFRIMYLNVQGLTAEKWEALFHAFRISQRSLHQSSLLLIAESHGPNEEVRKALAAEPFGWVKAMSGSSTREGHIDHPQDSRGGQMSRRGGLLVVARPDVLVTIHRITPYCCTLSVLPPGTFKAVLVHTVYLPPSMGHFEDWSLFKTFLVPSEGHAPDLLLGDINVRFPTGNMEYDKSVGPKARLQVVEDCISKLGLRRMIASKESTEEAQVSSRVDHAFVKQCSTFETTLQFKQAMIVTDHPLMKVTLEIANAEGR